MKVSEEHAHIQHASLLNDENTYAIITKQRVSKNLSKIEVDVQSEDQCKLEDAKWKQSSLQELPFQKEMAHTVNKLANKQTACGGK
mgnify:CR=1 FL=1